MKINRSFLEAIYANYLPLPVSHDDLTGCFVALYLLGEDHNLVGSTPWWIALSEAGIFERELEQERSRRLVTVFAPENVHPAQMQDLYAHLQQVPTQTDPM